MLQYLGEDTDLRVLHSDDPPVCLCCSISLKTQTYLSSAVMILLFVYVAVSRWRHGPTCPPQSWSSCLFMLQYLGEDTDLRVLRSDDPPVCLCCSTSWRHGPTCPPQSWSSCLFMLQYLGEDTDLRVLRSDDPPVCLCCSISVKTRTYVSSAVMILLFVYVAVSRWRHGPTCPPQSWSSCLFMLQYLGEDTNLRVLHSHDPPVYLCCSISVKTRTYVSSAVMILLFVYVAVSRWRHGPTCPPQWWSSCLPSHSRWLRSTLTHVNS